MDSLGNKIDEWELDNKTCDCCQTTAAITENGPVVIYRDRSDEEIRDMSIVRLVDGQWTEPKSIGTSSEARSSGFPQMTLAGDQLIFAWTDDKEGSVKVASVRL